MNTIQCREVIISTLSRRGNGTQLSPVRVITEVFEKDGTKIVEYDPNQEDRFVLMDLVHFARYVSEQTTPDVDIDEKLVYEWLESIK